MNYFDEFSRRINDRPSIINAISEPWGHLDNEPVCVRAFFSDVFSARQIDPRGVWKIHVFPGEGDGRAVMRLALTGEQRRELVEALGGIVPEWTQDDEDAYIARKSVRDWHLALKPEDV